MRRHDCIRLVVSTASVVVLLTVFSGAQLVQGAEAAVSNNEAGAVKATDSPKGGQAAGTAKTPKRQGQLPVFYARIVNKEQREAIYAIQQEYAEKISALKSQLAELTSQRDSKVQDVLTAEQQQKIDSLKAEASAKRNAKKKATQPEESASKPQRKTNPKS